MTHDRFTPPRLPKALEPRVAEMIAAAKQNLLLQQRMSQDEQTAFIRSLAEAKVIVSIGPLPKGVGLRGEVSISVIKGEDIIAALNAAGWELEDFVTVFVHDDMLATLWHIAYGDGDMGVVAREVLQSRDAGALDRLPYWLTLSQVDRVRKMGEKLRRNPNKKVPIEIKAAVRLADAWTASRPVSTPPDAVWH